MTILPDTLRPRLTPASAGIALAVVLLAAPLPAVAQILGDAALALPPVTITAQKEPAPMQSVPVSVTAVTAEVIRDGGLRQVRDAAVGAPSVLIHEFTARKLSNPYFRGIGSSPNNPGVTTYFDGVPQLNANSSSLTLLDVDQIEFVRGAASGLFGRNTVGGLINVTSRAPGAQWTGAVETAAGSHQAREALVRFSGPLDGERLGVGFAGGYASRDGFTKNTITGHDLDSREASFGKLQFRWQPAAEFSARLIVHGERDRDGDYALGDLAALRRTPRRVSRDFEGYTHRDVTAPTLQLDYRGRALQVSSVTGGVWWKTADATDLDYTAAPLITRRNDEKCRQLTQEIRFASPAGQSLTLTADCRLRWQAGLFCFDQDYDQSVWSNLSPYVAQTPFPLRDQTDAALNDQGQGLFGQGVFTIGREWDLTLGLRYDREEKDADLRAFVVPAVAPGSAVKTSRSFASWSPRFAVSRHVAPDVMLYASAARGFKAGGFNAIAPRGSEAYGLERSWTYEVGLKSECLARTLRTNLAFFYVDWNQLQLNLPVAFSPGRFYIANAGAARSQGLEVEFNCRPAAGWDVFVSGGCVDAKFAGGTRSAGLDVGGRKLPYAPEFTAYSGVQYSWRPRSDLRLFVRPQVNVSGRFAYDASNAASQGAYTVADFRFGAEARRWFAEVSVSNLTGTKYVPIALPFSTAFAPSGYVGESGAPATFAVRAGLRF
jgi:iron complex outermembrane receptor protein